MPLAALADIIQSWQEIDARRIVAWEF